MKVLRRVLIGWAAFVGGNIVAALVVRNLVPERGTELDDSVSIVAAMDGREFASLSDALTSVRVVAVMGGVALDLRGATIIDGATIAIRTYMGGVDIVVPDEWRVEVTSIAVMGGVDNGSNPDFGSDDAPLLVVDAVAVMGGVSVHPALNEED